MSRALRFASTADLPEHLRQRIDRAMGRAPKETQPRAVKGNKFGAKPTVVDGIRFQSQREARYYERLKLEQAAGEVLYFLRQVPFHLPDGSKYLADFLVVTKAGVRVVDTKGHQTPEFKLKKRAVEYHYPVRIELA